ncbi:MAG TPA: hypothetical protein VE548_13925 [Nitrososphaeraceae archaeon]|jgi:hypothetical protein|nr:hypothetical protein [Nitrososphaeraceae archaeon]
MTNQVIGYIIMIILLAIIISQQQELILASTKDGTNNQTIKSQSVNPEPPTDSNNATEPSSEPTPIPEEEANDDVFNCAALGCPGNPPNPHGPPTKEP